MDSQSFVLWGSNAVFWMTQKWLTLFTFMALIKMLRCVDAMDWNVTQKDMIRLTLSCLEYLRKIFLRSLLYHSQKYFFKWNIISWPYPEMLLISIIKLLFFFFQWSHWSMSLLVIPGGFNSRRFSYSKIF